MLITGAALFSIGLAVVIVKKNAIMVLMGIELMLNAANLNFIFFSNQFRAIHDGQFFALFVIVIAAAEAAIGLAIIVKLFRQFNTIDLDKIGDLKE